MRNEGKSNKVFVGNLSFSVNDGMLYDRFSSCGVIKSARVVTDRDTGKSRGFGFVEFESENEAEAAIRELNGADIAGRAINVSLAHPRESNDGGGGGFNNRRRF
jgi:cold-inducible RNA-binding protein